ncbi:MAG: aromatic amino acid lyase [Treponema sp.]|nr:aromatic amino acid lyase [Treponema sp.]
MITIDGENLSIEDVCAIAQKNEKVSFPKDKSFFETLESSRKFLEEYIAQGYPTYGVTAGFGDSCANQINYKKAQELQKSIVNFHGIGLGKKFSCEEGRAVVACRLNSDVKGGHSAIRVKLAERLLEFLNRGIVPVIPELGSVGASGDLTPLSYVAACVMGERDVYYNGKVVPASEALASEGLEPLPLEAKEGLAIMNGTSVMTAVASLAWKKAERLSHISDFLTAATAEIVRGNEVPFRRKVSEMKNHSGQIASSEFIYNIVKDSKRVYRYEDLLKKIGTIGDAQFKKQDIKIQDRYSIRCAPQINGVLRDTLLITKQWIEEEINSSNDNPLVNVETSELYNTGNFYGGHICASCDYLRVALANISDLADKQAEIIIDGKFNNLTENLIPVTDTNDERAGLRFGFKAAQITMSAIRAEIQHYCTPMSIQSSPTEALNQDKVSMGTISARKLRDQIELLYLQYAVHILAVCQAMDVAGKEEFSPFAKNVYDEVRKISSPLVDDRPLDKEAEKVASWLKQTAIFE